MADTLTAYATSRARFESWAALDAPHLPADPVDAMQVRLLRWEQAQPFWRVSSLPVALGCGEEAGELADAVRHHEIVDAVGDVAIYACQVATRHRLAFGEILDAAPNSDLNHMYDEWRELLSALGRVQHMILKREQRIRIGAESDEVFGEALAAALARMIAAITDAHGIDARDAFLATAEQVLARNWNTNPTNGTAP